MGRRLLAVRSSTPSAVARYCTFRAISPVPRAPRAHSQTRLHAISRWHRPVEAFYLPVLHRLPWTRKLERYSPCFASLLHSYQICGGGSSDFGLYQFFELMSRSIVMSSIWSATMRFNCAFSRSSSRSLCMLFESIPPYFAFQR